MERSFVDKDDDTNILTLDILVKAWKEQSVNNIE